MPETKLKTPDVTPAQALAVLGVVVGELVNNQWIDGNTQKLILGIASIVVPAAWVVADSIIRHGRAHAAAAIEAAKIHAKVTETRR